MIDYLITAPNKAAAELLKNDPFFKKLVNSTDGEWREDLCIADIKLWKVSENTTNQVEGQTVVIRHFLSGWYMLVAQSEENEELSAHDASVLAADREKAANGGTLEEFIIFSEIPLGELLDYKFSSTFGGSLYPFSKQS